jgi:hypothetical protein
VTHDGRSTGDLEARLRAALTLDPEAHALGDGVDMGPEAVTRRILDLAEMSSLCLELAARDAPGDEEPAPGSA